MILRVSRRHWRQGRLLPLGLLLCSILACGPAFLVLAKIDDAIEDHKDRQLPPYLCGNAICDRQRGESCRSCKADCGPCTVAPPELVVITPSTGSRQRWVSVFGAHLERVQQVWLVRGKRQLLLRHRKVSTRLDVYIPSNAFSGTLHIKAGNRRLATKLSYEVR